MISEDTQRRLDDAEREVDHKIEHIGMRFERNAKFLVILGICLGLYYRNLGLIAVLIVGVLPLLMGMIVALCMIGVAVRKYLRLCNEILGPDDDPDPDDEKAIPESPEESDSNIIPFPQNHKKAA